MNRQPASFFPTTALVSHPLSSYKKTYLKKTPLTGPCSRWTGCWHRHYVMYESTRFAQGQIPGHDYKAFRQSGETHMACVERHPAKPRMEGPLSWNHPKYCRKCLQLGFLLPLVRISLNARNSMLRSTLKVTTCSKSVLPAGILQNHSQRPNISCVPPKRVRTSQFKNEGTNVLTRHSLFFFFYRCRDCRHHEPFVARPSANVYFATRLSDGLSRSMECVLC